MRVILQLAYGRLTRVVPVARRVLDVVDDVGVNGSVKGANGSVKGANGHAEGAVGDTGGTLTASKLVADGDYTNGGANGAVVGSEPGP